jgi:NAD(P)-dependent dehydrogenase (short-subunit alcohol dehydrogenase family)
VDDSALTTIWKRGVYICAKQDSTNLSTTTGQPDCRVSSSPGWQVCGADGQRPECRTGGELVSVSLGASPGLQVDIALPSVVITGANRGLGFEFAKQYAAEGWRVYAGCRHPAAATELNRLASGSSGAVTVLNLDVSALDTVTAAARSLNRQSVDVLINNAGIMGRPHLPADKMDYESWAQVFDINSMGPLRVTMAFAGHLARSDRKLVVTISSGMGSIADNQSGGSIDYRSSKAAVNMVMRSVAIEFASRGISCVLVNPGWVRTDMGGPGARLAPSESVAALRNLIESLGPAQSGKFFHYDGREYQW